MKDLNKEIYILAVNTADHYGKFICAISEYAWNLCDIYGSIDNAVNDYDVECSSDVYDILTLVISDIWTVYDMRDIFQWIIDQLG